MGFIHKRYGNYPEELDLVMEKIRKDKYYSYKHILPLLICAFIPLCCLSSVGPEAGLTGIIAALCYLVADNGLSDDKRPGGCILVKGLSDSLLVDYLVAIDDSAGIRTAELLISAADAVKETEGEDTVICLHAFNPTAYRMTKKLLGGSEPEKISDAVYLTRKL